MKNIILLIGSVPPPHHGSNIYFASILSSKITKEFKAHHLDTSDHRGLSNLGKFDLRNIYLGIKNIFHLIISIVRYTPKIIYLSPGSNVGSFIRDGLFILISHYLSNAVIIIHMHSGTYFRDVFYAKSNILLRYFIRFSLAKVNVAIVLGERLRITVEGLVKEILVIPNGTNFNPDISQKKYGRNGYINVSYLGNYMESKGIIDILNAAEIIIEKYDNVIFKFAGNWRDQESRARILVDGYIRTYSGKVQFIGPVYNQEKERYLVETDIFVFPTWMKHESFGLVILKQWLQVAQ
jgi:glycosyltransferase involved in cell wall biosynthesis